MVLKGDTIIYENWLMTIDITMACQFDVIFFLALCGKLQPLKLNLPITYVPGTVRYKYQYIYTSLPLYLQCYVAYCNKDINTDDHLSARAVLVHLTWRFCL